MLSTLRCAAAAAFAGAVLAVLGTATAGASDPPAPPYPAPAGYHWDYDPFSATFTLTVNSTADDGDDDDSEGKDPTKGTKQVVKPTCQFKGAAQACTDKTLGNWSNSHQCYMTRAEPQPPPGDYRWQGHTDGSIWACAREQGYDKGRHVVSEWVWLPGKPDIVVPDPETLAYEAIAAMKLEEPLIKTAPGAAQVGLVNMPVWLWVNKTESTWGPISRTATVPGLSVTATAHVKAINWSMGDGSTVRCDGPGTPYDKSMGVRDSPTCGHRYTKTSHKLPNCKYPVTATAQWDINWRSTLGDTGNISVTQQAATQVRIGEAVPVLVDPDGGDAKAADSKC